MLCVNAFRARRFLRAARCFEKLGQALGPGKQLPLLKRYAKGRFLRNGAVAYARAAEGQKSAPEAAYLRERALKLLRTYREERLCENSYRCRIALDRESKLFKQIGYAQLAIASNASDGAILVVGHRYRRVAKGSLNAEVRPGPYTITVTYPGKKPKLRKIQVEPGQKSVQSFKAPGFISRVSVVLYIAGITAVLAGGTFVALGAVNWFGAEARWNDPSSSQSEEGQLLQQRNDAQPMLFAGGGGVALGLILVILAASFQSPPKRPVALSQKAGAQTPNRAHFAFSVGGPR